jgi:hypothetical protein
MLRIGSLEAASILLNREEQAIALRQLDWLL